MTYRQSKPSRATNEEAAAKMRAQKARFERKTVAYRSDRAGHVIKRDNGDEREVTIKKSAPARTEADDAQGSLTNDSDCSITSG